MLNLRSFSTYLLFVLGWLTIGLAAEEVTVYQTALVIAPNINETDYVVTTLQGYDAPYEILLVPQAGITLPTLEGSNGGNYGAIIVIDQVSYDYGGTIGWRSAFTDDQLNALYAYQVKYNVRMVQWNIYPEAIPGVTIVNGTNSSSDGCCNVEEQYVSLYNDYPLGGLMAGNLSTLNIWHYPAQITDPTSVKPFLKFWVNNEYAEETVAGITKVWPDGREEMDFFLAGGSNLLTSAYLGHVWFQWAYRGLFNGYRRVYLSTQIDDVLLTTVLHQIAVDPQGGRGRIVPLDVDHHIHWTQEINQAMNNGSDFIIELGFNGNGNEEQAALASQWTCPPSVSRSDPPSPDTDAEYVKPVGTGTNMWPANVTYSWNTSCSQQDQLARHFQNTTIRDSFAWVSHTFTHENLDNATLSDTMHEIQFNQEYGKQVGFASAARFAANGLIPPAITGLHNGDALKSFYDNGIYFVVGDNTRDVLRNQANYFWPLNTTVEVNGFAGVQITPRWSTRMYWDCSNTDENIDEWYSTLPQERGTHGNASIYDLLINEAKDHPRNLIYLFHDPYMFHQANLRVYDVFDTTINGVTKQRSLLQMWVEVIVTEFNRLVNWPMLTLGHDEISQNFQDRYNRDQCKPNLRYFMDTTNNITQITAFEVSASGNSCPLSIPVTIPAGTVTSLQGSTTEQIGNDPLTIWVPLNGQAKKFTLTQPITLDGKATVSSGKVAGTGPVAFPGTNYSPSSRTAVAEQEASYSGAARRDFPLGILFLTIFIGSLIL